MNDDSKDCWSCPGREKSTHAGVEKLEPAENMLTNTHSNGVIFTTGPGGRRDRPTLLAALTLPGQKRLSLLRDGMIEPR